MVKIGLKTVAADDVVAAILTVTNNGAITSQVMVGCVATGVAARPDIYAEWLKLMQRYANAVIGDAATKYGLNVKPLAEETP